MTKPVVTLELGSAGGDWLDVSSYLKLTDGITSTRGRQDEVSDVAPSVLNLRLDNTSGLFTPGMQPVNLVTNPSFTVDVAGWMPYSGCTVDRVFSPAAGSAPGALRATATAAGSMAVAQDSAAGTPGLIPVTAGQPYSAQVMIRSAATSRQAGVGVFWYGATGRYLSAAPTALITTSTTAWGLSKLTTTAPAGAAYAQLFVNFPTVAAGEIHYLDVVMLEHSATVSDYAASFVVDVGTPIRLSTTVGGVLDRRFTGTVDSWPMSFPGGPQLTDVAITCTSRDSRWGKRLRSVLEETVALYKPSAYYVLGEAEGSSTAGDTSGKQQAAMTVQQHGAGGTVEFAAGTGPSTDGTSAPVITRADAVNGPYLRALLSGDSIRNSTAPWSLHVTWLSTAPASQLIAALGNGTDYAYGITTNTAGQLCINGNNNDYATHNVNSCDGRTHDLTLTCSGAGYNSSGDAYYQLYLYKDGVQILGATINYALSFRGTRLLVGGSSVSAQLTGTVSHVALFPAELTSTQASAIAVAAKSGFTSDRSNNRIARYAGWGGIPIADMTFETGDLATTGHLPTSGVTLAAALQAVVTTENGMLFVDGTGELIFHARSHRYNPTPVVSLIGHDLDRDTEIPLDSQYLVNVANMTRTNGAAQVVRDDASVTRYGEYPVDLELLVNTDDEAYQAGQWIVSAGSKPTPRLPAARVDLLTQSTAFDVAMQALELGDLIKITDLPAQAWQHVAQVFVEGWTETISDREWSLTLNTSPLRTVWVLGDPTYGMLDGNVGLAY